MKRIEIISGIIKNHKKFDIQFYFLSEKYLEGYNFMSFPKCPIRFLILDWSQVKCKAAVIKHHLINPFQWRVGLVLKTQSYHSNILIDS